VPNEKRARHKAARQARMAELRRAQQRRRNMKRGGVVGIAVLIALILALYSGGVIFAKKKHPTTSTANTTTTKPTTTTTTTPSTTTTVPVASVQPKPLSVVEAALTPRSAPAHSSSCSASTSRSSAPTTTIPAKAPAVATIAAPKTVGFPNLNGSAPHYTKFSSAPPFCINVNDTYTATVKTTAGTFVAELLPKYAPVTVNSFVFLAGYHFYDGIVFHRVIPGFVDQGGDPTGTGNGGPGYKFNDELPKSNAAYDAGALAMANSGANTNGSQFFIVAGDGGSQLTAAYTMFGQVTSGLSVVNKINAGGGTLADSGVPPKILYKMLSVTISVSGPGAAKS
jgi:cyclophilin family peptidyl-prolyl cis-trans isomerase